MAAFTDAFRSLGFEVCQNPVLELGCTKIAIFVNRLGIPTHAARQLTDGAWTSKLGPYKDISHELHALEGDEYGRVSLIMKKVIQ